MTYKSIMGNLFGIDTDLGPMFNLQPISSLFGTLPRGYGRDTFVDSVTGHTNSSGRSPSQAVTTIALALAKTRANKGDRVICLSGHAESISVATTLPATAAGVQIIGLGLGRNRPTLTFDTANTAAYTVPVDNVTFANFNIVGNFLSIAAAFVLTTAKGFRLQNCKVIDTSSVLNFLNVVKSTGAANTADGVHLESNVWNGLGTTSVNSFALIADAFDGGRFFSNRIKLARTATAAILLTQTTGAATDILMEDNTAISQQTADTGGGFANIGANSTGLVRNNLLGDLSTTDLFMTATVGVTFDNNRKTGVISASAYLLPATDS